MAVGSGHADPVKAPQDVLSPFLGPSSEQASRGRDCDMETKRQATASKQRKTDHPGKGPEARGKRRESGQPQRMWRQLEQARRGCRQLSLGVHQARELPQTTMDKGLEAGVGQ